MKRKGTKRRIMVMLIAVMMLMASSVTSFARKIAQNDNVEGILEWYGSGARARTYAKAGYGDVYVCVSVEFLTASGNMYNTGNVTKTGNAAVIATAMPGNIKRCISAVSYHGRYSKEFMLTINAN